MYPNVDNAIQALKFALEYAKFALGYAKGRGRSGACYVHLNMVHSWTGLWEAGDQSCCGISGAELTVTGAEMGS